MSHLWEKLLDLVIPEEKRLAKLLQLNQSELRKLLPRSRDIEDKLTFPVFNYRNRHVSLLVWALKYRGHKKVMERIAEILYEEIIELALDLLPFEGKAHIALVPIPMSKKSRQSRGWNQTEELAEAISKKSNREISVLNILEKSRETKHQTKLPRTERLQNMKGSIRLREGSAGQVRADSLLIIIDDVYTTGATINEARRALREIGVENVPAITIAH